MSHTGGNPTVAPTAQHGSQGGRSLGDTHELMGIQTNVGWRGGGHPRPWAEPHVALRWESQGDKAATGGVGTVCAPR